jgi:glycosyltransferase involved in cell wall biosynthesis
MKIQECDAIVLTSSPFAGDPRHLSWAEYLSAKGFDVLRVEILEEGVDLRKSIGGEVRDGVLSVFSNRGPRRAEIAKWPAVGSLPAHSILGRFLKNRLLRQLTATTSNILDGLHPSLVIANDLSGAILALSMWSDSEAKIIYDAQEVFTDAYDMLEGPRLTAAEQDAWITLETDVCRRVAHVVTVSPGIAALYAERHDVDTAVVPNFVPSARHVPSQQLHRSGPVRFVYVGRADPHRGLEELVTMWDFPEDVMTLDMIIAQSPAREHLYKLSQRCTRRFAGPQFCKPVLPTEIISVLSTYEVGVLPYSYPYPYSHASPNKLGEYIAAGLAVVATDQSFVAKILTEFEIGKIFNWQNSGSFSAAVLEVSNRSCLETLRSRVATVRSSNLTWETFAEIFWTQAANLGPHTFKIAKDCTPVCLSASPVMQKASIWSSTSWMVRRAALRFARQNSTRVAKFLGLLRRSNSHSLDP